MQEFKIALLAQPDYSPALHYLQMVETILQPSPQPEEKIIPARPMPRIYIPSEAMNESLDLVEIEKEMISERASIQPRSAGRLPIAKKTVLSMTIWLDGSLNKISQPIQLELGKYITVMGNNVQRFLLTQPDILSIEKDSQNQLRIIGQNLGYTYVHVWDANGRWTMQFLTVPPKAEGISFADQMHQAEESAKNFKLRYVMDWYTYGSGENPSNVKRLNYSYTHYLSLEGPTPYGNLDSSMMFRNLNGETEFSTATLGLEKGRIGPFKDFSLRAMDFHSGVSNLAFSDPYQRGVLLKSPAFNQRLDYALFWGREQPGIYTFSLSPGLEKKTIDSFLSGINLNFTPREKERYSFTIAHGWGKERDMRPDLNPYGYDLNANYHLGNWNLDYEVGYDSQALANLFKAFYNLPGFQFSTELRDSDKNFNSLTGLGYRAGERGALSTLSWEPSERFRTQGQLDVYQDRLFPSTSNPDSWNQDLRWQANYTIDKLTGLWLDYNLQNDLGKISESRYENAGIGLNRGFEFIRRLNTFVNYRHQENTDYSAHAIDYINDKVTAGLRFSLIGQVYYYLNGEFNWLKARLSAENTTPHAVETGLEWSERVLDSPFYGNFRFTYRNEENTSSPLSFLSGENYVEGYGELTYRPQPGEEVYCSSRLRDVWPENPDLKKRIEAEFRAGLRYLWNTGVRWESIGTIEGYVFKDYNDDGLRQRDEPPLEGIKVWLGKDKFLVTDIFGYYKFTKVRAKKVYISIDVSSLPPGFVLTGPAVQEAMITHGGVSKISFGIVSRSEISGIIFEDTNGNGKPDPGEKGIRGVILVLEDGTKAITDNSGKYYFRKAGAGKHTVALDLNSLPAVYIPTVPVFKDLQVFEGVVYNYSIPLKKSAK